MNRNHISIVSATNEISFGKKSLSKLPPILNSNNDFSIENYGSP